jgi:branched-chain amino acid transport system substrate-binding protein
MTGPIAPLIANVNGIKAAVNGVNRRGGINGHQVNFVALDDGGDPTRAIANMRQLINEKHSSAIIGMLGSVTAAATAPIAETAMVPLVGNLVLDPYRPFIFSTQPNFASQGRAQADFIQQLATSGVINQKPRVAILGFTTPAGVAWHDGLVKQAAVLSLNIVADQGAPNGAQDYTAQVARIAASKPDVIATWLASSYLQTAATEMAATNINPKTPIVSYAGPTVSFLKTFTWQNFYTLFVSKDSHAGSTQMFTNLQADAPRVGDDPDGAFFVQGYAEAMLAMDAMKACGYPCSGKQLQHSMEQTNTTLGGLAFGPFIWDSTYHYGWTVGQFAKWNSATGSVNYVGNTVSLKP